jgi:hypothetical protein
MRETCARVLAAALLTGAIASVVALAAHLGPAPDPGGPIAAPPSALQRTVHLTARPEPRPSRPAEQVVAAVTIHGPPPARAVTARLVVAKHRARQPAPKRQLAAIVAPPVPAATSRTTRMRACRAYGPESDPSESPSPRGTSGVACRRGSASRF